MRQKNIAALIFYACSLACAACCFLMAAHYFNGGIMYVAETSSNPTPSETAKVMGPYMMKRAEIWFFAGIGFIVLVLVRLTVLLNRVVAKKALIVSNATHQVNQELDK